MLKQININNQDLTYTLRRSFRARRIRLTVSRDGAIIVTIPIGIQETVAQRFIAEKMNWISKKVKYFRDHPTAPVIRRTRQDYLQHKEQARQIISELVNRYCTDYGFKFKSISIRNQKTCWGSCSRRGNLNFNYRLIFLPERTQEYVVVHELCHLKEMNHSGKFWDLVSRIIPEYKECKKGLRIMALK